MISALTRVGHGWLAELVHKCSQLEWHRTSKSNKARFTKDILDALEEIDNCGLAEENLRSVVSRHVDLMFVDRILFVVVEELMRPTTRYMKSIVEVLGSS